MGFFSWKTSDTEESISNVYSERGTFPVYVLFPDGTVLKETDYEGYGVFGGRDIYALLAQWNSIEIFDEEGNLLSDEELRFVGIKLAFGEEPVKYPIKIVENPNLKYENVKPSEDCEYQGYFYD